MNQQVPLGTGELRIVVGVGRSHAKSDPAPATNALMHQAILAGSPESQYRPRPRSLIPEGLDRIRVSGPNGNGI
jgi:hypothetical protein